MHVLTFNIALNKRCCHLSQDLFKEAGYTYQSNKQAGIK